MAERQNNQQQQIAVIQPTRMQMPAHVAEEYGLTADTWRAVVDAIFPLAKTPGAVLMALAYCKKRNLDIFARVVHIVPMRVGSKEVETVWPGIGLQRITAQRQDDFDGWDDCELGPEKEYHFQGRVQKWEDGRRAGWEDIEWKGTVPEWARFTFYKMRHGRRLAMPGPKTYFTESFAPISAFCNVPNARWQRAPRQMLMKNAEAAALRMGWPDVFGDEPTAEEMDGKSFATQGDLPEGEYVEVGEDRASAEPTDKAAPRRADFGAEARTQEEGPAKQQGRQRSERDEGYEQQGRQAAEQADQGQYDDAGYDQDTGEVDRSHEGRQQDAPKEHVPGPVPEGFDHWQAWANHISDLLKCAANLPKLDKVAKENGSILDTAPTEIQTEQKDLYADKRQEHIEATK